MPFDLDAHRRAMEEFRLSRILKADFVMTANGPDRNAIWTTYHAFLRGEISFPLAYGYWPDWRFYEDQFIGPRPPKNRWWIPWDKRDHSTDFCFFQNNGVLPDPSEVIEFIRSNAVTPVKLGYSWHEKGDRLPTWSKDLVVFTPGASAAENVTFERTLRRAFSWLEWEEAWSVDFYFTDVKLGGEFKKTFYERY